MSTDSRLEHAPVNLSARQRAQNLIAALPLPDGTLAVGVGLVVSGITTYLFQILAFRGLSKPDYGALNALWVFVFVLAPGIFLPVEQEVGRALAARRAHGIGGAPVIRRAGLIGLMFATGLGIATIILAVTTSLVDNLFAGNVGLVICLVIALFTFGFELLARGAFAGAGEFGAYGVSMGAEGIIRLLPCIVLVAVGSTDPVGFGLCLAIPPALATLVALRGQHRLMTPGPEAPWSELSTNLGLLLGGSLLAQVLSYAPFLGAQLLATSAERVMVADFIVGLFLSRIPILLFQAVQAALLPRLAAQVSAGQTDDFRRGMRNLLLVVSGIGVVGVIGGATLGPVRRPPPLRRQVRARQPRPRPARGRERDVHLRPHHVAGVDRARRAGTGAGVVAGRRGRVHRGDAGVVDRPVHPGGDRLDRRRGAAALTMSLMFVRQLRKGIDRTSLAALVEQIEHEPLEI